MREVVVLVLLLFSSYVTAQNKQLLYNVEELPQTLLSNPGNVIDFDKHIGIPLLSGFSLEVGSSGVSFHDIFETDGDINTAIDRAISTLDENDYFSINQQLEILSFGWTSKRSGIYFSGGLYHEIDALLYFPKDIAVLAYRGNAGFVDTPFEFLDISFTAESLSVYHFGINKKVNDSWQLGARGKIYMSVANLTSIGNEGSFFTRTTPDGPNFFTHSLRDVDLKVKTSGVASFFDNEIGTDAKEIIGNAIFSENFGFGFDLGFTHFVNEQVTVTGSLVDIGFIRHRSDVRNLVARGDFDTNGLELEFPAILDGQNTTPYWENLQEEFEDAISLSDSLSDPYTSLRPLKVNSSIQYSFGEDRGRACNCRSGNKRIYKNSAGLHLYSIKRPKGFQTALTGVYERKWGDKLLSRFTYTYDKRSAKNVGLLMSAKIDKFNLYLAADNLLEYANLAKANGASFQIGMQLVFDEK